MASYTGIVSSLIKGSSTGGENAVLTGISTSTINSAVPLRYFNSAVWALKVQGVSGTFSCDVVGAISGATVIIAGKTGIATNGSIFLGNSSIVPCPSYVSWASAVNGSGFTGTVYMSGEYS